MKRAIIALMAMAMAYCVSYAIIIITTGNEEMAAAVSIVPAFGAIVITFAAPEKKGKQ